MHAHIAIHNHAPPPQLSVMLAAKFFDDQYFNNAYYAKVRPLAPALLHRLPLPASFFCGARFATRTFPARTQVGGVPCGEVNSLEVEFLFMTNFNLFVATDEYSQVMRTNFLPLFKAPLYPTFPCSSTYSPFPFFHTHLPVLH